MRVTIIYPDYAPAIHGSWPGYLHYGVASVSASLKHAGHDTSLIHVTEPTTDEAFVTRLRQTAPDLIGFSSTTNFFGVCLELLGWLRNAGITVPVIFGGVHATLATEEVIAAAGVDYVCIGEGEAPIVELCNRLETGGSIRDIPNIWAKEGQTIFRNAARPLRQNLDELPFADRAVFNYSNLAYERQGIATLMASRGCPFNCTYCCNHALSSNYPHQRYVRFRSVDHVLAEIKQIREYYPFVQALHFDDDILFLQKDWFKEFTEKYPREVGLPFQCNYRPGLHDETAMQALAQAGCRHVQIGLESGNEAVRTRVLGRHISSESIAKAVALAHKYKMSIETNSMVGVPGETPQAMLDTVKLNARTGPDRMFVSIFYPFPRTHLYDLCVEKGYITDRTTTSFFFDSILKLDTVSREQIVMFKRYFPLLALTYRCVFSLRPTALSRQSERVVDFILTRRTTAKLAFWAFGPALWLRRRLLPARRNMLSDSATQATAHRLCDAPQ